MVNKFIFQILTSISVPIQLDNRDQLVKSASTSLNSKVVSQQSSQLAPLAVDAVLKIVDPGNARLVVSTEVTVINHHFLL